MQWSDPATLVGIGLGAAAISAAGTHWGLAYARRQGLLDLPGARRSHAAPTPRGGGVGIVVASVTLLLLVAVMEHQPLPWMLIAAGLLLVSGIGWWDDHRPLGAWPRLLAHAAAGGLLALALWMHGAGTVVALAGFVLAVGLVNAWNFMDGIDGLAASQALLCGLALASVLAAPWAGFGIALAGACLGFLPYNLPRARVFLGDVGSGALGYLMAVLLAASFAQRPVDGWPLMLLAPMAMLLDAGLTLAWRMRRGERWWQAHADHLFQRLSRRHGHGRVSFAYALWTMAAIGVMLALNGKPVLPTLVISISAFMAGALVWRSLHDDEESPTQGSGS